MEILYEDNHLIIVNKAVGEIVQGDKTGDEPLSETLKGYIKEKYNKPGAVFCGVTHRLDRPVSGVVVFARTSKALERMNRMFAAKSSHLHLSSQPSVKTEPAPSPMSTCLQSPVKTEPAPSPMPTCLQSPVKTEPAPSPDYIHKTYWAIVCGTPLDDKGTLKNWLIRNEKQNKSYAYDHEKPGAKEAILDYEVIARGDRYTLLNIILHTGRHHQIRCQLAAAGMPIKGDLKYGAPRSNPDGGISLHARSIEFIHPVRHEPIRITADPPQTDIWHKLLP